MVSLCWDVDQDEVNEQLSSRLIGLIGNCRDDGVNISGEEITNGKYTQLDEALQIYRRDMLKRYIERNDFLMDRKMKVSAFGIEHGDND